MGAGRERSRCLGEKQRGESSKNGAADGKGPGRNSAGGEHSCIENRFCDFTAMQRAPKLAHLCFNREAVWNERFVGAGKLAGRAGAI